jgi:16S rRNA processing protein RimM
VSDLVSIARIVRAHGIRGGVVARPASDGSDVLLHLEQVDLRRPGGTTTHRVRRSGWLGRQILLELDGIPDRNAAEAMVGAEAVVPKAALPPAGEDEFYVDQLVGLEVRDGSGKTVGRVAGIEAASLQTWLVVDIAGASRLVPFTEGLVSVDLVSRVVRVDAPEGLFDDPAAL